MRRATGGAAIRLALGIAAVAVLVPGSGMRGAVAQDSMPDQAIPGDTNAPPPSDGKTASAPAWVAQGTAELQALDKVNARSMILRVKVGTTAAYGSLSIAVQSCFVRPPDQPQDAATFLTIIDSHAGEPGFRGWMFAASPAVSMLEHPIYDVRLLGCRP